MDQGVKVSPRKRFPLSAVTPQALARASTRPGLRPLRVTARAFLLEGKGRRPRRAAVAYDEYRGALERHAMGERNGYADGVGIRPAQFSLAAIDCVDGADLRGQRVQ